MARKLKNIKVEEVSLVNRPANMRKFLIIKGEVMDKFIELLKKYCVDQKGKPISDLDYEKIAKMDISAETIAELTKSIESLSEYQSDTPYEMIESITGIVKHAVFVSKSIEKDDSIDDLVAKLEKSGQKFSRETKAKLKSLRDEIDSLIPKDDDEEKNDEKKVEKETGPDIQKMFTESLSPIIKSITELTESFTKVNGRVLELEKGDTESKQIKKETRKPFNKETDDPYETITKAWFSNSEECDNE